MRCRKAHEAVPAGFTRGVAAGHSMLTLQRPAAQPRQSRPRPWRRSRCGFKQGAGIAATLGVLLRKEGGGGNM